MILALASKRREIQSEGTAGKQVLLGLYFKENLKTSVVTFQHVSLATRN